MENRCASLSIPKVKDIVVNDISEYQFATIARNLRSPTVERWTKRKKNKKKNKKKKRRRKKNLPQFNDDVEDSLSSPSSSSSSSCSTDDEEDSLESFVQLLYDDSERLAQQSLANAVELVPTILSVSASRKGQPTKTRYRPHDEYTTQSRVDRETLNTADPLTNKFFDALERVVRINSVYTDARRCCKPCTLRIMMLHGAEKRHRRCFRAMTLYNLLNVYAANVPRLTYFVVKVAHCHQLLLEALGVQNDLLTRCTLDDIVYHYFVNCCVHFMPFIAAGDNWTTDRRQRHGATYGSAGGADNAYVKRRAGVKLYGHVKELVNAQSLQLEIRKSFTASLDSVSSAFFKIKTLPSAAGIAANKYGDTGAESYQKLCNCKDGISWSFTVNALPPRQQQQQPLQNNNDEEESAIEICIGGIQNPPPRTLARPRQRQRGDNKALSLQPPATLQSVKNRVRFAKTLLFARLNNARANFVNASAAIVTAAAAVPTPSLPPPPPPLRATLTAQVSVESVRLAFDVFDTWLFDERRADAVDRELNPQMRELTHLVPENLDRGDTDSSNFPVTVNQLNRAESLVDDYSRACVTSSTQTGANGQSGAFNSFLLIHRALYANYDCPFCYIEYFAVAREQILFDRKLYAAGGEEEQEEEREEEKSGSRRRKRSRAEEECVIDQVVAVYRDIIDYCARSISRVSRNHFDPVAFELPSQSSIAPVVLASYRATASIYNRSLLPSVFDDIAFTRHYFDRYTGGSYCGINSTTVARSLSHICDIDRLLGPGSCGDGLVTRVDEFLAGYFLDGILVAQNRLPCPYLMAALAFGDLTQHNRRVQEKLAITVAEHIVKR